MGVSVVTRAIIIGGVIYTCIRNIMENKESDLFSDINTWYTEREKTEPKQKDLLYFGNIMRKKKR